MQLSENSDTMWQYILGYYMTSEFPILYDTTVSDTIWYFLFGYYGILGKRIKSLSNTVVGKHTCKFATFKKLRLVLSKRGIYFKDSIMFY